MFRLCCPFYVVVIEIACAVASVVVDDQMRELNVEEVDSVAVVEV